MIKARTLESKNGKEMRGRGKREGMEKRTKREKEGRKPGKRKIENQKRRV